MCQVWNEAFSRDLYIISLRKTPQWHYYLHFTEETSKSRWIAQGHLLKHGLCHGFTQHCVLEPNLVPYTIAVSRHSIHSWWMKEYLNQTLLHEFILPLADVEILSQGKWCPGLSFSGNDYSHSNVLVGYRNVPDFFSFSRAIVLKMWSLAQQHWCHQWAH